VSWVSGDKRRLYYATASPSAENTEQRTVTLRIWSHEGVLTEQRTASIPPGERPGFICAGDVAMIGMLSSGEPAIQQVCLPQTRDASAPQLNRLFALRGDTLSLIARAVDHKPALGDWGRRALWRVRLPKSLMLLEGGETPLF
jgi:hypothetical protein